MTSAVFNIDISVPIFKDIDMTHTPYIPPILYYYGSILSGIHYMMTCVCVIHSILACRSTSYITKMTPDSVYTLPIYRQYYIIIMAVHRVVYTI